MFINVFKEILNIDIEREDNSEVCNYYGEQLLLSNEIKNYQQLKEEYEKCTFEDVINLAKNIFNYDKMVIIQMGDINKNTFKTKTLKIFS